MVPQEAGALTATPGPYRLLLSTAEMHIQKEARNTGLWIGKWHKYGVSSKGIPASLGGKSLPLLAASVSEELAF